MGKYREAEKEAWASKEGARRNKTALAREQSGGALVSRSYMENSVGGDYIKCMYHRIRREKAGLKK